jgi:hypothetical protein
MDAAGRKLLLPTRKRPVGVISLSAVIGGLHPHRSNACAINRLGQDKKSHVQKVIAMSKPTKSAAELIAMAKAELKAHADCPEGIEISVMTSADGWEFRTTAGEATIAKPGYPECVALIVQIGDHLAKQYDVQN